MFLQLAAVDASIGSVRPHHPRQLEERLHVSGKDVHDIDTAPASDSLGTQNCLVNARNPIRVIRVLS